MEELISRLLDGTIDPNKIDRMIAGSRPSALSPLPHYDLFMHARHALSHPAHNTLIACMQVDV